MARPHEVRYDGASRRIFFSHQLRNAILPVVTVLGPAELEAEGLRTILAVSRGSKVIAAISITGPSSQVSLQHAPQLIAQLGSSGAHILDTEVWACPEHPGGLAH